MADKTKRRVLIIGLDGATFDIIEPLVAQDRLPHLGRFMKRGSYAPLRSAYPPITPTAWTSFATGKNPGHHGLYDFLQIESGGYGFAPVAANQHGQRTLWGILSDQDRRSVVLDVPFTYPPEPIQGCMVTGYGTPVAEGTVFTSPAELRDELIDQCGSCQVATVGGRLELSDAYFDRWDSILSSRKRIASYLMDKVEWDLFMIVYGVTDNMQHNLWAFVEPQHPAYHSDRGQRYRELLFSYYDQVDASIGELLAHCGSDTHVLVMSDHGFGSTRTSKYLSKMLIDEGLIRYKGLPIVSKATTWVMQRLLHLYHSTPLLGSVVRSLSGSQRKGLKQALARTSLLPTFENVDWERTLAFPGGYGLQVYINRQDRFPLGTVRSGPEYERLVQRITERLLALTDPVSGESVVQAVHRASEIYQGPFVDQAPDLIVEYTNVYQPSQGRTNDRLNPGLEGNHTMEGIFVGYGPHIAANRGLQPKIIDLAPTALYLMGLPVPKDMDGRVLTEIISPSYLAEQPVEYSDEAAASVCEDTSYTKEEAASVYDQLRALGYID